MSVCKVCVEKEWVGVFVGESESFLRNGTSGISWAYSHKVVRTNSPVYTSTLKQFQIGLGQLCKRP